MLKRGASGVKREDPDRLRKLSPQKKKKTTEVSDYIQYEKERRRETNREHKNQLSKL